MVVVFLQTLLNLLHREISSMDGVEQGDDPAVEEAPDGPAAEAGT
jgi:hypothetical protein